MSLNRLLIVGALLLAVLIPLGVAAYRVDDWNAVWVRYVRWSTGAKIGRPDKMGGKQINLWEYKEDPNLGARVAKGVKQYANEVEGKDGEAERKPDFDAAREEARRAYAEEHDTKDLRDSVNKKPAKPKEAKGQ